jgi:DNA-binding NtrC family response regulator
MRRQHRRLEGRLTSLGGGLFSIGSAWTSSTASSLNICLSQKNGLQLLEEIKRLAPFVSIVFITAHGDVSIGGQAMRDGAVEVVFNQASLIKDN